MQLNGNAYLLSDVLTVKFCIHILSQAQVKKCESHQNLNMTYRSISLCEVSS